MKSKLSREEIDKLLGVDSTETIPTTVEIGLIIKSKRTVPFDS